MKVMIEMVPKISELVTLESPEKNMSSTLNKDHPMNKKSQENGNVLAEATLATHGTSQETTDKDLFSARNHLKPVTNSMLLKDESSLDVGLLSIFSDVKDQMKLKARHMNL